MTIKEKKEQIQLIIKDLFFLSESDYPWLISEKFSLDDVITEQQIDTDIFFEKLTHPIDMVDDFMRTQSEKYQELHDFLKENFTTIFITKHGRIKRPLIIELKDEENGKLYLTTFSIET
ncbi:MAG: hypothetical protein RL708_1541 [Bacteroidota bacterium]|jgi:hypothetical protein